MPMNHLQSDPRQIL